jgi:hypothetical protein
MNQMYEPTFFVIHFTAGNTGLQNLEDQWKRQCGVGGNAHFGVERYPNPNSQPGDIWQWCQLYDGACANCCTESGHAPFLPSGNLNVYTISVENINADTGNNGAMPQAQFDGLTYLIKTVCADLGIPTDRYTEYWNGYENTHTWGDVSGGIIMHRDIAPQNRRMCPGEPYYNGQLDQLMLEVNFQNGGIMSNPDYVKHLHPDAVENWVQRHFLAMYNLVNTNRPADQQIAPPPMTTGIYGYYKDQLKAGNDLGAVISWEYQEGWHFVQDYTNCQISYDNRATAPYGRYDILPGSQK